MSEKLCLQWNDFKANTNSAFGRLRDDKGFTDVTLACEDGQQVEAHKVVLLASSPFFLNILKRNKHPHPLIYMRGVRSENMKAMVDFFYYGETNVDQENLDSFLVLAEELRLKGLRGNQTEKGEDNFQGQAPIGKPQQTLPTSRSASKKYPLSKHVLYENGLAHGAGEKALAMINESTNNTDVESLDKQVKSMMTVSENVDLRGRKKRICKACGKEGSMGNIMDHIEAHHITGISIPCELCGKIFTSRISLRTHKSRFHRSKEIC